jgi:hypothetical protein
MSIAPLFDGAHLSAAKNLIGLAAFGKITLVA